MINLIVGSTSIEVKLVEVLYRRDLFFSMIELFNDWLHRETSSISCKSKWWSQLFHKILHGGLSETPLAKEALHS